MNLLTVGKLLVGMGLAVAVIGALIWAAGRIAPGGLPGDIVLRRGRATFFFPIATSIVLSALLSLVLTLLARWRR